MTLFQHLDSHNSSVMGSYVITGNPSGPMVLCLHNTTASQILNLSSSSVTILTTILFLILLINTFSKEHWFLSNAFNQKAAGKGKAL